ncbi:ATP-binding protein [Streptomyces sp. NPDC088124]|uniref:ATP-binding protein n=1 Tax=Streptomyces sp. NPDC088124 TaxID=3154654 RepID=UPI00341C5DE3
MLEAEFAHLVDQQLPSLQRGLWQGQPEVMPAPLFPELEGTAFSASRDAVLKLFVDVTVQASERAENATRATVASMARSMQTLVRDTEIAVDEMLDQHHEPSVLEGVTRIDHTSNQLVRRLQGLLAIAGAWPGRKRPVSPLLDVVRSGVSKIRDYRRVEITGNPAYAVVGQVVEPLALALAELLDNAARQSTPKSPVRVGFTVGHNGVTVTIDDSGTGLSPEVRAAAPDRLSAARPVLLTQMGSLPEFGFAVIGTHAARYGFRVSVDEQSIYGGVRAALFLPESLLTKPEEPASMPAGLPAAEPSASRPVSAPRGGTDTADGPGSAHETAASLPQRRRRSQQLPQQHVVEPPSGTAATLGALARGRRAAQEDQRRVDERNSES